MFLKRVQKVKDELKKAKLDAVFISSPISITYLTGQSGFVDARDAYVLITQNKNYILTHSIYSKVTKVKGFEIIEISRNLPPQKAILKILGKNARLGIEENNLTVSEYKNLKSFNTKNFEINQHRAIKSSEEIALIEKACRIGDKAYGYIRKHIKEGITEKEIAFKLEYFIKNLGADLAFPTICAFGVNSFAPHHQTGNKKLEKGRFVLIDFGVKWQGYCSDMTRTTVFGEASKEQKKIYDTVLEAQQKAINVVSNRACDFDKAARDYIKSQGYPDIPHSVGHGIGLAVHEHPYISKKSKEKLENGMVFSIEPGIYLPAGGVRIEDLFVLENNKLRKLTGGIS